MSVPRLMAILFIFVCSALAWFVLGVSVAHRTGEYDYMLETEVVQLWGGRHVQGAPNVWIRDVVQRSETVEEENDAGEKVTRVVTKDVERWTPLPLDTSDIHVELELMHRRKGLLWYDLYAVQFNADYTITAPDVVEGPVRVSFTFPAPEAIYDSFTFQVGDQQGSADNLQSAVTVTVDEVTPGERIPIQIRYNSRGLDTWTYAFRDQGVGQVNDFTLTMVNNFDDVDFPAGTISPTSRVADTAGGEQVTWRFDNLVTGKRLGVDLPNRLNPGPLTQRVTFFAPVSLLFFFTVMVIVGITQDRNLHPMHYFFLAAAFFSFHLLLAYLVDHVSVHVAFATSALVSVFLVVSYLRLVGGFDFAVRQAGLAQFVYLVLFNYAFFFQGFTGLAITIGSIVTLFALMQLTARVDWEQAFVSRRVRPSTSSA